MASNILAQDLLYTGPRIPLYGTLPATLGTPYPSLHARVPRVCHATDRCAGEVDWAMGLRLEPFTRQGLRLQSGL